jgi:HlyD family secretion protein
VSQAIEATAAPTTRLSLAQLVDREKARKIRGRTILVGAVVLLAALIVAVWLVLRPRPVPLATRFRAQAVTRGDVVRNVSATGHLEAVTTVQVGAEISGRISTVEVDYNDVVKQGQVLARFDRAALQAQFAESGATLAAAKAALEQAKTDRDKSGRDLSRVERLWADKSISDAEHDNAVSASRLDVQRVSAAEAQVAAQAASYSVTRTNLDHSIIYAPISGVVITRNVDPGQTVASTFQTPILFTVAADLRKMRVIAAVDESDIGELAPKQGATFTVNAYGEREFRGIVTEVRNSPIVVQDVVTYGTVVEVDNLDLALKPGMTATVKIRTAQAHDALRAPATALHFTPPGEHSSDHPGLWLLEGASFRRVEVTPGVSDGEMTAFELDPSGSGTLREGDSVLYELTTDGRKAYGLSH